MSQQQQQQQQQYTRDDLARLYKYSQEKKHRATVQNDIHLFVKQVLDANEEGFTSFTTQPMNYRKEHVEILRAGIVAAFPDSLVSLVESSERNDFVRTRFRVEWDDNGV
jgi:hypothetical protein